MQSGQGGRLAHRPGSGQGSRVVRCWGHPDGHDLLVVPYEGQEIHIPADPAELLPLLAESGRGGLSLIGDPEPERMLAGPACPGCGKGDVNWLSVDDDSETAHCDRCGTDFGLPDQSGSHASSSRLPAE
jgi:hypothetical protein